MLALRILRGDRGPEEDGEDIDPDAPTSWRAVGIIALAFLAHALLINVVGWPLAVTAMFGVVAWALGARGIVRPLVAGGITSVVIWLRVRQGPGRGAARRRSCSSSRRGGCDVRGGSGVVPSSGGAEMEAFDELLNGFGQALTPINLLFALLGVVLGTAVGVLPGIGPAMTVALLLPITYVLEPTAAFIMFAGIYYGGMYGGSTTSILLNTPGESSSIMTALEGNKMAKAGRGAAALGTAAIGSFVAGTIATLLLALVAPTVVELAIASARPTTSRWPCSPSWPWRRCWAPPRCAGWPRSASGCSSGLVGTDLLSGQQRFNFGMPQLADGIDVVIVAVALFAVGEALHVASRLRHGPVEVMSSSGSFLTREDFRRSWKPWLRGHRLRLPLRGPAGGRRGDPDLPLLRHRAPADQAPGASSATGPSRASPVPRPPTTRRPPVCWCRC